MAGKVTKGYQVSIAGVVAILGAVTAWQTAGGWMPASQASVEVTVEYSEESRLLLLYHLLDDLRHRLHDADGRACPGRFLLRIAAETRARGD